MSFEVKVNLILINSCFVLSVSETRIRVPSDLTTFSNGLMRNAKGRLSKRVVSAFLGVSHSIASVG